MTNEYFIFLLLNSFITSLLEDTQHIANLPVFPPTSSKVLVLLLNTISKASLKELSEKVGIANVNLSKLKTGKVNAIRFSTLEAICEVLNCQPGDILEYDPDAEEE